MKKRLIALMTAFVLGTSFAAATVMAEETKTMGEQTDASKEVKVTNSTGKTITGLALYSEEDGAFGENLILNGDVFVADETRVLYYTAPEGAEDTTEYMIQLTYDDYSTAEMHTVPLGDASEDGITLKATGDGFLFASYKSVSQDKETDTKMTEMAWLKENSDIDFSGTGEQEEYNAMAEGCLDNGLVE